MNVSTESVSAEKYLTRRLLGEYWSNYEGCSRFSVFWRASRLNHLTSSEVHSTLGVRVGKHEDAFEKLTHTTVEPHKMVSLSSDGAIDPSRWSMDYWWPFAGSIPWKSMPWRIRVCPACARYCYHSMLFQVPGIQCCPWHRVALVDACPRCNASFSMGLNDGSLLGVCRCGHDLVDYVATVLGDGATLAVKQKALARYSTWAKSSRSTNYLISPSTFDPFAWRALHTFASQIPDAMAQPNNLMEWPTELILECISTGRSGSRGWRHCTYDLGDYFPHPFTLSLPSAWQASLAQILTHLVNKVSLTERKRMASNPRVHQRMRDLAAYLGVDCVHLPTEYIEHSTLEMLNSLEWFMVMKSSIKVHPMVGALVRRTFQRVLCRGYAAAVRAAFAPELLGSQIADPSLQVHDECNFSRGFTELLAALRRHQDRCLAMRRARYPWVLLCLPHERPPSARIAWTLQTGER